MNFQDPQDTICALSTAEGVGAISLIRLSGNQSVPIISQIFSKSLKDKNSHSAHYGIIKKGQEIIDEVVVTYFKGPNSFTGEDIIEIACHGSRFIQEEILSLLISKGARLAGPGEFSLRAFLNKKMDLSQAEAIADLIASNTAAAHKVAMNQMRGGYSTEISELRQELMNFASLIELELDFSEEDVEFAERSALEDLLKVIREKLVSLVSSFKYGNVIKNGVPVAIVGAPNAGKSTLLNNLLNEDKAIVSDIAGTTRDAIEDTIVLDGIEFRFIDTAGIRETVDAIETQGIQKAFEKIKSAHLVLLLFDLAGETEQEVLKQIENFRKKRITEGQELICLFNKSDQIKASDFKKLKDVGFFISAKTGDNVQDLKDLLVATVKKNESASENVVTNFRHYSILSACLLSIDKIKEALDYQISGDLMAMDIRETLDLLGSITGEISSDDLLGNIFSKFCIGK